MADHQSAPGRAHATAPPIERHVVTSRGDIRITPVDETGMTYFQFATDPFLASFILRLTPVELAALSMAVDDRLVELEVVADDQIATIYSRRFGSVAPALEPVDQRTDQ
jgi:hypothetical protein